MPRRRAIASYVTTSTTGPWASGRSASRALAAIVSGAFAVGFLAAPLFTVVGRRFLWLCAAVMFIQRAVGLLGFYYLWVPKTSSAGWIDAKKGR
jgi:hypothetical protein